MGNSSGWAGPNQCQSSEISGLHLIQRLGFGGFAASGPYSVTTPSINQRGVTQESGMTLASVLEQATYYVERFGGMLSFTLLFAAAFYGFEAVLGKFGIKVGGKPMNTISH